MNEPYYSIICNLIRLSPVVFIGITWLIGYYLFTNHNKFRFFLTLAVRYIIGLFSVWGDWDFATQFAPTEKIAAEIVTKDGAPMVVAPFIMPIYVGIYFLIMSPVTWVVIKVCPRNNVRLRVFQAKVSAKGNVPVIKNPTSYKD